MTDVPKEASHWLHEIKFDGYRIQAHLKHGIGKFFTRNALDWSHTFPNLLNALEAIQVKDAVLDGEIVALDESGKTNFQLLQNLLKSKDVKRLRFYVFDILFLNGRDLRSLPLFERKEILLDLIKDTSELIQYSEHLDGDGEEFYQVSCEYKLEGIISKLKDASYHSGRNDLWVKTKCSMRQEFVIGGWTDPKGGRAGLGALLLGIYEKGKFKYVGKVGTGFNHASLLQIKKDLVKLKSEKNYFELNAPKGRGIHWVRPVKVCEVSFGNWTNEGILRTPVFHGMREDKIAKDIHMDQVMSIKSISSPDKVIFSQEGITKKNILDFYRSISKVMLPYLSNRPLSVVRCLGGAEGECFFQKHINGKVPEGLHAFPVKEEKGAGIYFSINSSQGLKELVQLNAFEIHAWNCQYDSYLVPDQIVMDFDPGPGVPWIKVVEGSFELKEMLDDLDLKSFVKVTGGKGVHIHIPIAPIYNWDEIKSFAQGLALELVSRYPTKYVTNMSKKMRNKKIFVDYLRNGYGSTSVVPYSLRARAKSAVALPVEWNELKRLKGADTFTMDKALKKIKSRSKDPWAGMLKLKQKITILDMMSKQLKAS